MKSTAGDGTRAGTGRRDADPGGGALEIEFEDEYLSPAVVEAPAGRSRDLRPVTMAGLGAVLLGAVLWGTHAAPVHDSGASQLKLTFTPEPNYAAYVVTVRYQGSHLLSLGDRRIEVDLRVTPVPGAQVRIIDYYISENGVTARADPPPSMTPLPASGIDVKLDLTVDDCSVVPIGESMSFVDVVADGPVGTMDRFTILGEQYSADLARMLAEVCPGRVVISGT
jgi:hypothetical protein